MNGPEWAELRLKLVSEVTLSNQGTYLDDVECPARLLSVLEALNCKNTTSNMQGNLQNLQFQTAYNHDPKVLDSLIQKNCSQMPDKYVDLCKINLTKKLPPIELLGLISDLGKCYEEQKRASNSSLTHR